MYTHISYVHVGPYQCVKTPAAIIHTQGEAALSCCSSAGVYRSAPAAVKLKNDVSGTAKPNPASDKLHLPDSSAFSHAQHRTEVRMRLWPFLSCLRLRNQNVFLLIKTRSERRCVTYSRPVLSLYVYFIITKAERRRTNLCSGKQYHFPLLP